MTNRFLVGVAAVVTLIVVFLGFQGRQFSMAAATDGVLPGTGSLSGTVKAPGPFKAARVYVRNVDKDVLFMVYTSGGAYRAVNLFPGNYEVHVEEKGFISDAQKVVVSVGANATLNFSLRLDPSPPT